ncbi:TetR/AcrR family transcriptional regulator [Microbulbifer agarilyticus]|uniref:TetR/AcrR family transcriptional regulator n=1 Tax=Microbulbifer agarilyticus TaxID=260552 RepID=UPI001C93E16F|nr:TetR family transcriptional regulator [Microbulbifer agarilyticus]MBY6190919.1 TetR family transcriptional regulator [Microbulbifer agarilyticus]MBY6211525.1 TetR family transcriptional regulator [Microbulbifer agarilyticus]MCA0893457.1 TetR family transcriptional regulator [Microbulbifer agarilyticus]
MSSVTATSNGGRTRRVQERAEATKAKLVDAGRLMFSERGFDAVSLRDIENAAKVKRGLLAYHFGDKEAFWKSVVATVFSGMHEEFEQRLGLLREVSESEHLAFIVRFYVGYHARHPELSRLMAQEATRDSWRIQYLIEQYIAPACEKMQRLVGDSLQLDRDAFVHWYYIMVSASSTIFSFAPECRRLFNIDPCEEVRVDRHADMLVQMLLRLKQE